MSWLFSKLWTQQRPLHCYLLLSVWIFLMIAGMYKYIANVENMSMPKQSLLRRDTHKNIKGDVKLQKIIRRFCNNPDRIQINSEGNIKSDSWTLQGVIEIVRHGDRGPLTHVRDIESVNCDAPYPTPLLQRFQEYINNASGAGKAPWAQSPGPFHNFPLLPSAPTTACRIGQLTLVGVQQLLTIGTLLGKAYTSKLGWNVLFNNTGSLKANSKADKKHFNANKNVSSYSTDKNLITKKNQTEIRSSKIPEKDANKKSTNNDVKKDEMNIDNKGRILEGDIVVHSTRYRRALQSALALVWAMLGGNFGVGGAVAYESPSLAFCSSDCACPAADKYAKILSHELKERLEVHPAIKDLVNQLSKIVSQSPSQISNDPHVLEDALLVYLCHSAPLPCMEKPIDTSKPEKGNKNNKKNILPKNVESSDVKDSKSRRLLSSKRLLNAYNPFEYEKGSNIKNSKTRLFDSRPKPAPLDFDSQMEKEKLGYYQQKLLENADSNYQDVVLVKRNMDGDFNFNGDLPNIGDLQDMNDSEDYDDKDEIKDKDEKSVNMETVCVRKDQVTGLFAYTDWEMKQSLKSINLKRVSLLRAYGMIRHIVQYILQMISEGKPKFVLYSGHDKTLQYLGLALGLSSDNILHIQYASRLSLEVYKSVNKGLSNKQKNHKSKISNAPKMAPLDFYFRLVLNGQDITNYLSFCKKNIYVLLENEIEVTGTIKGKNLRVYLCKIENIIRFIHEDYFSIFNATNFKDACIIRQK